MMKKTWWVLAAALMLCAAACDDQRYSSGAEVQQEDQDNADEDNTDNGDEGDEQDLDDNNREEDDDEDLDDVDDEDLNDDEELPPNACRDSNDCADSGQGCMGVDISVCGIPPQEGCFGDEDCLGGEVCMSILDQCSFDGVGSACRLPCERDDQCGPELFCNDAGRCQAIPCTEPEAACPQYMECDPGRILPDARIADQHSGCFYVSCREDGDCNEQEFCVNSICQSGLGFCGDPVP